MKHLNIYIVLLPLIILASCTNSDCNQNTFLTTNVFLYNVSVSTANNSRTASVKSIDSIWVKGIDVDSVLYKNKKNINHISLPLNNLGDFSLFVIRFNNIYDTVSIKHTNATEFISMECGTIRTFHIDTVITTHHYLDSVKISLHNVNTKTNALENIKFYH